MNMRPTFSEPSEILAQYDALADRVNNGQTVGAGEALAAASALAMALRASLMTTTAIAPRPKRAKAGAALAFDMGAQSFARALKLAMRACAGRSTLPIFSAVRLEASGDALRLTCSDADREISVMVEAPGVGEWAAVVNAKALAAVVGKAKGPLTLHGEATELRSKGGHEWRDTILHVSGAATARLEGLCVDDWPRSLEPVSPVSLPVNPNELRDLLTYAAPAMSDEATRYYLNGAFMHVADGHLVAVATDGHRMHRARMGGWDGIDFAPVIIHRAAVADMLAVLATPADTFTFAVSKRGVAMTMGPVSMASKTVDGSFPDYTRVFSSSKPDVVEVVAADLDSALEKAAALRGRRAAIAQVEFGPDAVEVTARTTEGVTVKSTVAAPGCILAPDMRFNADQLRDAIKAAGSERVTLRIFGPNDAIEVRPAGGDGSRAALVMPLRK